MPAHAPTRSQPGRIRLRVAGSLIVSLLVAMSLSLSLAVPVAAATSARLTRYPYLTDVSGSAAAINWATDRSATTGHATYGKVGVESCTAHRVNAAETAITVGSVGEYQWRAQLTLSADTRYCYRVFLDGTAPVDLLASDPSPTFTTQLAPGSQTPFSFAVLGDWGSVNSSGANRDQANLMARIAASGARFALTTGDNAYPSGSQANYGDLQQVGSGLSAVFGPRSWAVPGRSIPIFPAQGNHGFSGASVALTNWPQAATSASGRYRLDTYSGIDGTTAASYPSVWYAFSVGSARLYVLEAAWSDSNIGTAGDKYQVDHDYHWTGSSAEYQWLQRDLAAYPSALKLAFFHFPMFSDNSTETSDKWLRGSNSLEGLLDQYRVRIAFNGHAHIYERNKAVNGDTFVSYVTGGGGAPLEPIGSACSSWDAYGLGWSPSKGTGSKCGSAPVPTSSSQVFHFLLVTVNGYTVTVTPTDELGRTFDIQTYAFGGA
ncbi:MAG: metallophosphoesterase [Candidatus Limnocylindrales bacterium]